MKRAFTLEYWQDDGWYVGKLKEVPGIFSQGETLAELEENIEDAYKLLMAEEQKTNHPISKTKEMLVEIAWNAAILLGNCLMQAVILNAMAINTIFTQIRQMANKRQSQGTQKLKKAFAYLSKSNWVYEKLPSISLYKV